MSMAKKRDPNSVDEPEKIQAISKITLSGFKSICGPTPQEIKIAPLTVLAGANSSGKSSVMQPLLLLKQTIEASYDPGPLLLHGPHVRFTSTHQIFPIGIPETDFSIGLQEAGRAEITFRFRAASEHSLNLIEMVVRTMTGNLHLVEGLASAEIDARLEPSFNLWKRAFTPPDGPPIEFEVKRDRCFMTIVLKNEAAYLNTDLNPGSYFSELIREIFHLAGLRGNPERSYGVSSTSANMPGSFEPYVASVILDWQRRDDPKLEQLNAAIAQLGLSWKIEAKQIDASAVELKVGRLPKSKNGGHDLVNIADVGFGVSQALPVVVALLKAKPGQIVYIEQPEIHLHPKAQEAMAHLLAEAANRGVRVVVETHSATILLTLQTLIAGGKLKPEDAVFHWFARDEHGVTKITSVVPDESGAYGDWPEDFSSTQLSVDQKYIEAVEARLFP